MSQTNGMRCLGIFLEVSSDRGIITPSKSDREKTHHAATAVRTVIHALRHRIDRYQCDTGPMC
jgi:hypothetical protein